MIPAISVPWTDLARRWIHLGGEPDHLRDLAEEVAAGLPREVLADIVTAYCADRIDKASRALIRKAERTQRGPIKSFEEIAADLQSGVDTFVRELRAEWNAELLAMTFMVNGRRVTWGDATIDDHLTRAASLRGKAAGTVLTAQKHELAARRLDELEARTLNEAISPRQEQAVPA